MNGVLVRELRTLDLRCRATHLWVNSIDSPDSLPAAQWIKLNSIMSKNTHLTTWLSSESKEQFAALAGAQGLSESACLKRLVEAALVIAYGKQPELPQTAESFASSGRISVRLRSDDLLLPTRAFQCSHDANQHICLPSGAGAPSCADTAADSRTRCIEARRRGDRCDRAQPEPDSAPL